MTQQNTQEKCSGLAGDARRHVHGGNSRLSLSSKLLRIGRLPEFADSNISLRIADIETTPSDGRSHRAPISSVLTGPLCHSNRPNRPNGPNKVQDAPGALLLRPAVGRFSEGAAESAHETGPLALTHGPHRRMRTFTFS